MTSFSQLVERILRQQQEARLAAESERLQKEKAHAELVSDLPNNSQAERSLMVADKSASAQSPNPATGSLSGILNRHLNFQNLKRRTGLVSNESGRPPLVSEHQSVMDKPGISSPPAPAPPSPAPQRPQSPATKPSAPDEEYSLNQQYLSEAGQPQPPVRDQDNDLMPGGFPATANFISSDKSPQSTPLSHICEYPRCCIDPILNGYLARNIELAIDSCKPESGNLLQNRERMYRVKESVDDGYCDISGRKENLHNIGMLGLFRGSFRSTKDFLL